MRKKREELASVQKQHVKEWVQNLCIIARKTFVCPKCKLDFVTERDLKFHQCDADSHAQEEEMKKQVAEKKKRTQLASTVFKKPVLKDEVQILHDIMKK